MQQGHWLRFQLQPTAQLPVSHLRVVFQGILIDQFQRCWQALSRTEPLKRLNELLMGGGIKIEPMKKIMGFRTFLDFSCVNQQWWSLRQRFCSGLNEHTAALGHQMGHQPPQTIATMQSHVALKAMDQELIEPIPKCQFGIERTVLRTQAFDLDLQHRLAGLNHGLVQDLWHGRHGLISPTPRHVAGKDLVGRLNLTVLIKQRPEHTAAASPLVPSGDPNHLQACGEEGWNMNIE